MEKQKKRLIAKQIKNQKEKYSIIAFVQEKLGQGSFGSCYLGYDPIMRDLLAIKSIKAPKDKEQYQKTKEKYKKQVKNLSILTNQKHRVDKTQTKVSNLVFVHPVTFKNQDYFYIAMQFCNGGDLQHLIKNHQEKGITTSQFLLILSDLINGYYELRSNGMIHQDLKQQNIFIKDGIFKIGDFGLSFKLSPGKKNGRGGSRPYNAPQKYTGKQPSHKSDIFALGVILFEIYYNNHPFYNSQEWNVYLYKQVVKRVEQNQQWKAAFTGPHNPNRRYYQNQLFFQFLQKCKIKKFKPWIKQQFKVLSQQKHKKLEQIIQKMICLDIEQRIDFQQLKDQLNELNIPDISRNVFAIPQKCIPEQCVIYVQQIQGADSLTKTICDLNLKSQIFQTDQTINLKKQAQYTIIRSRILADLQFQINRFAQEYNQKLLKEISELILEQVLIFVKDQIKRFQKQLAKLTQQQKVSFYSHNYDSLIGVLKCHSSYLRGLFNDQPDKIMQKQRKKLLDQKIIQFMQNLLILGEQNCHIIVALDLYKRIIDYQSIQEQKQINPQEYLPLKNMTIYKKTKVQQAQQVYIRKKIKLPPAIEYADD